MEDSRKPWYQTTYLWGQVNLTEDDPEKCDLSLWKEYWKQCKIEGVIINCGGIVRYYQSEFAYQYKAATLGDRDYFGEWNKAAREAGLKVIARMDSNCTSREMYDKYPSWYCRSIEGDPILVQGRYVTCVNGGYYQSFLPKVFREIISKYSPEGFADNSWAGLGSQTICYCQNCREKFRARYGRELPEKVDWKDPDYRKWVRWNYDIRIENWLYFNQVTQDYGGRDCRWFGMINADPFQTGGRFYDIRRLIQNAEFIFCDHQSRDKIGGFEQNAVGGKLLHMASDENIIIAESMAHYYKGIRTFRLASGEKQEIRKWMLSGISGGISPWYHFVGGRALDCRKLSASVDIFHWHKSVRKYLTNRTNIANVGIVWNQETSIYYRRGASIEKSAYPWYGITQALSEAGIAFVPIHADDIDKYSERLQTLVLPNLAIMNKEQAESIVRWIEQGKHLIISGETGCYDEEGEWVGGQFLYDKLGLTILPEKLGVSEADEDSWLVYDKHNYMRLQDKEHPIFRLLQGTELLPLGGTVQRNSSTGVLTVLATYIPPFPIYPPEFAWIREESGEAVIYAGSLRSGSRVVYLAADLDRCYAKFQLPDHQRLLQGVLEWCAGNNYPVKVEAQAHVDLSIYEQEDCYILHLLNLAGCRVPLGTLRENLPIGPVGIRLGEDIKVARVHSECNHEDYPISQTLRGQEIILPVLREQELLILHKP